MATGKKSAKTSKTAHVLNVITGVEASGETADSAAVVSPVHAPVAPILEVARANDDALADTILSALTAEVENSGSAPTEEPAPETPPAQAQASEKEPEAASEAANPSQSIPAPPAASSEQAEEIPAESAEHGKPEEQAPMDQPSHTKEQYYNITQALVEERAPKYMKMMGICMCPRCQADVKALALSNLTPKYIVMQPSQVTPMFSVYEGKFGAAVTAQIISACRVVQDRPRH